MNEGRFPGQFKDKGKTYVELLNSGLLSKYSPKKFYLIVEGATTLSDIYFLIEGHGWVTITVANRDYVKFEAEAKKSGHSIVYESPKYPNLRKNLPSLEARIF